MDHRYITIVEVGFRATLFNYSTTVEAWYPLNPNNSNAPLDWLEGRMRNVWVRSRVSFTVDRGTRGAFG